jgi:hypothetical protein
MPADRVKKGAPKVRHLGLHQPRVQRKLQTYYLIVYPRRKILHLLKHNTVDEARSWAAKHMCTGIFLDLLKARQ